MTKLASALLPTRLRPDGAIASIHSLVKNAMDPRRVEVLLRVDSDDPTDYNQVIAEVGTMVDVSLTIGKRHGYRSLNEYYNELARLARGRWCLLWNDDVAMMTPGWDDALAEIPGRVVVAGTEANHGRSPIIFPIFTREFAEALGHVSLNCHNDTWIEEVGMGAGIVVPAPIRVHHQKFDDQTERDGAPVEGTDPSHGYYSEEMASARARDVARLREYMRWRR